MRLILASRSPRRREILERAGIAFEVGTAEVDESAVPGESAAEHVRRLARAKVGAVRAPAGAVVLGADTVVVVEERILGKPTDASDAVRMLRLLAGRWHEVMTGICLRAPGGLSEDVETTRVRFTRLTKDEIQSYVESGEPMDKAGGYAIQGLASKYIDRVEGCYFNVVGLPVALVYRRLRGLMGEPGADQEQPGYHQP